jgi:hypothetical protein
MLEKRPWMFCGTGIPVIFDVLNRERKEVARIHRDGTKWFVQFMDDYRYSEARFNSPDEALASLS